MQRAAAGTVTSVCRPQLEVEGLTVGDGKRKVLAELTRALDGWWLRQWFAVPNAWLQERAPVELDDVRSGFGPSLPAPIFSS
jgi:hypothetical protein